MSITKCGNLSIGKSIFRIISAAGLKKEYKHGSFFRVVERRDETLIHRRAKRQAKFWFSAVRTEFQITFQEKKDQTSLG